VGVITGLQEKFDWRGVAASAVGAGVGRGLDVAMGYNPAVDGFDFSKSFASSLGAGTAAAVMRGGKVAVQQVAIDAFGNALGSSLASQSNSSMSSVTEHVDNDAGYRLPGQYVERDNSDVVFHGQGLQPGRGGFGVKLSASSVGAWSDQIDAGIAQRAQREAQIDANRAAEAARLRQTQLTAAATAEADQKRYDAMRTGAWSGRTN